MLFGHRISNIFSFSQLLSALMVVFLLGHVNSINGQARAITPFTYLSPLPSSQYVNPEHHIAFRLLKNSIGIEKFKYLKIEVVGSESGVVGGNLILADDFRTYIYQPDHPFLHGEKVSVGIQTLPDLDIFHFDFTIGKVAKSYQKQVLVNLMENEFQLMENSLEELSQDGLSSGLPDITIMHENNPMPGYFFLGTISNKSRSNEYIALYDNQANPVFYRELKNNSPSDFKLQPNGNLSYHGRTHWEFYELNPFFEVIDTIKAGNGLLTDNHELLILENGHKFLLGYDVQLVDMSLIVSGGNPMATVTGLIVQELDSNNEVVFEWRSWDHFEITDAADRINLQGSIIDYVHGNSIELDTDSTMIISSRNMDEVTRINRQTGEIIWRLGGKRNQFELLDSSQWFCHQHDARIVPTNGNLSIFDNGNCHSPKVSGAMEYELDCDQMTVRFVRRLEADPPIYGSFMGNAQRLQNGRTVVGWGSGIPSITEFDAQGNVALQFSFNNINYRAFKFNWQSPTIVANVDTLIYNATQMGESIIKSIDLTNNFDQSIEITSAFFHQENFELLEELPIVLAPQESRSFDVEFSPDSMGNYQDVITLCWDINQDDLKQRISRQVFLSGRCSDQSAVDDVVANSNIHVFPNPTDGLIHVSSSNIPMVQLQVINWMGTTILEKDYLSCKTLSLRLDFPSGLYFLKVITQNQQQQTFRIIKTDNTF